MSNRVKEGCWVGILTVFHAIFTVFVLGKLAVIIFYQMEILSAISFGIWAIYLVALYMLTSIYDNNIKLSAKVVFKSCVFGGGMALCKGIMDTIGELLYVYENRFIAIETQVELLLFGIILFAVLQIIVARKRIVFDLKKAMAPVVAVAIVLVVYLVQVCNNLGDYTAYKHYATTEVQLYNLDMYIAHKILNHNIWSYVLLYICFWWFMQRITVSKEIKDC